MHCGHADCSGKGSLQSMSSRKWPVYIHEKLQLVLVVYVDDFKMAGPQKNLAQGWSMLRTRLKIEPETGLDMYLGCNQSKGNVTLGNGLKP